MLSAFVSLVVFFFAGIYSMDGQALVQSVRSQVPSKSEDATFQFTDINNRSIELSQYRGKWVLVNFWAPWCPLCFAEVPTLNALNANENFAVIGVAMDYGPDPSVVAQSIDSKGMNFEAHILGGRRVDLDPQTPFRQVGPVDFYPTSYLYSPTGERVMFIPGMIRASKIQDFIKRYPTKSTSL